MIRLVIILFWMDRDRIQRLATVTSHMNNTEVIEATIIITAIRFQCPAGVIGMIMHLRPTAIRMDRIVIRARPLIMGILTMHLCANDSYSKKTGP